MQMLLPKDLQELVRQVANRKSGPTEKMLEGVYELVRSQG